MTVMAAPITRNIFMRSIGVNRTNLFLLCQHTCATFASKELQTSQLQIKVDDILQQQIQQKLATPKNHPGKVLNKRVDVPSRLHKATLAVRNDYQIPSLQENAEKFARHLNGRKPPIGSNELRKIASEIELDVLNKEKVNPLDLDESKRAAYLGKIKSKVLHRLRRTVYHWKPISYNAYKSFLYMSSRLAPEYAILIRVFDEIARRDPEFKPVSLFDFGSGLGSVTWAANQIWGRWLSEHYCVDPSGDMNTLARLLMQDGEEQKEPCFRGVYFRQFMPKTENPYNLVVSAYTLLELPNKEERISSLLSLWNRTQDYLVLVENGTNVGYHLLMEARKHILKNGGSEAHIFAPCAHDEVCPRFQDGSGIPCNFSMHYKPLDSADNVKKLERFTYAVFKKVSRDKEGNWPRIVRQLAKPSKHVHCRLCLANGKLGHVILTAKKHGKEVYQCARQSELGDRLPATVELITTKTEQEANAECNPTISIPLADGKEQTREVYEYDPSLST